MFNTFFSNYKEEYISTLNHLNQADIDELLRIIVDTINEENYIYVVGNGGSSASASHWVCDFNKGVSYKKRNLKVKFVSLTDNIPIMTAYGNDISYDDIFSEQLKNVLTEDDVVILLSVSGNSRNLLKAQDYANLVGAKTVSITGMKQNRLKETSDLAISVPSENYGIVEDVHMYICHLLSQYISQ